jgi:hypothetical protein
MSTDKLSVDDTEAGGGGTDGGGAGRFSLGGGPRGGRSSGIPAQFRKSIQSFTTVNPKGKNSIYDRLPDNRWVRTKTATGETHVQGITRFVHPNYGKKQVHPIKDVSDYNPLELAAAHGELLHHSGKIQVKLVGPDGKSTPYTVPDKHISTEPIPGWHVVEHTVDKSGKISSYHLGHAVAPFNKSSFRGSSSSGSSYTGRGD